MQKNGEIFDLAPRIFIQNGNIIQVWNLYGKTLKLAPLAVTMVCQDF